MKRPLLTHCAGVALAAVSPGRRAGRRLRPRIARRDRRAPSLLRPVGGRPRHQAAPRSEILAQDIAPFRDFSWDKSFTLHRRRGHARRSRSDGAGIPARMAKFNGDQGCTILPRGETDIHFKPVAVPRNLPDADN